MLNLIVPLIKPLCFYIAEEGKSTCVCVSGQSMRALFQKDIFLTRGVPISIRPTEIQSIWIQIGKERREAGKPDDANINREPKQRLNQTNQRGCLAWNQN